MNRTVSTAGLIVFTLVLNGTAQEDSPKRSLFPQVWSDPATGLFHSPECKLIKVPPMARIPRTMAKLQGMKPAVECSLTDLQARDQWAKILKDPKKEHLTRAGGTSEFHPSLPPASKTTAKTTSAGKPPTGSVVVTGKKEPIATSSGPSWNEVMNASNFYEAPKVIAAHCRREYGEQHELHNYCLEQQHAAVDRLKTGRPTGADKQTWDTARVRCAREWPTDYRMRLWCEEKANR